MLSAELRLITLIETLIIYDITKTESVNCFIVHCFEENNIKHRVTLTQYDVAFGNHNLCTQPTDYSLLCDIDLLADN